MGIRRVVSRAFRIRSVIEDPGDTKLQAGEPLFILPMRFLLILRTVRKERVNPKTGNHDAVYRIVSRLVDFRLLRRETEGTIDIGIAFFIQVQKISVRLHKFFHIVILIPGELVKDEFSCMRSSGGHAFQRNTAPHKRNRTVFIGVDAVPCAGELLRVIMGIHFQKLQASRNTAIFRNARLVGKGSGTYPVFLLHKGEERLRFQDFLDTALLQILLCNNENILFVFFDAVAVNRLFLHFDAVAGNRLFLHKIVYPERKTVFHKPVSVERQLRCIISGLHGVLRGKNTVFIRLIITKIDVMQRLLP